MVVVTLAWPPLGKTRLLPSIVICGTLAGPGLVNVTVHGPVPVTATEVRVGNASSAAFTCAAEAL